MPEEIKQEDVIITGHSQIPIGIAELAKGRAVLVAPPYLEALLYEARKRNLAVEVSDCGLFFEVYSHGGN